MAVTANTSLEELFTISKETLGELQPREEFIVKELFKGFEWNRIAKGTRTKLGSLFFNFSKNEGIAIIDSLGKTPQNQQRYKKL